MRRCRDCGQEDQSQFYEDRSYCKDCDKKRTKKWVRANSKRHQGNMKAWAQRDPEGFREASRRAHVNSNALRRGAEGTHTSDEFLQLCEAWGWLCVYCERELSRDTVTKDHVIPLTSGGDNTIHNLLPCCQPCNSSKGSKSLGEWLG